MPGFPDVVPVLADDVVTLRAHREQDVDAIIEQANDPEMVRWTTVPTPYGPDQAREFLELIAAQWGEAGGSRLWAIEAGDGDRRRFAGTVDLRPRGAAMWDVGFALHPWARGRGMMSAALRLVCVHAFAHLGAESVSWKAVVGNWGSRRVAWACGFRVDGVVRGLLDHRGQRLDGWTGSLRKGEPMSPRSRWLDIPVLEGDTLRLRPWRDTDRPGRGWSTDEQTALFMQGYPPEHNSYDVWLRSVGDRAADGEAVSWCIADLAEDRPLGRISCFRLNNARTAGTGQVGYWLHPSARGRGITDEALRLVIDVAFRPADAGGLGLHRLAAGTDIDNRASSRVLVRNGFRPVGVERSAVARPQGPPVDGPLFELLADERERRPPRPLTAPVVRLRGIRLRPWADADRPPAGWQPDATAQRFLPPGGQPTHESFPDWVRTRRWRMDAGEAVQWAIADAASDAVVGTVAVLRIGVPDDGNAELGYWLYPDARGKGCIDQAVDAAVAHAFAPVAAGGLGLRRLFAVTVQENRASMDVLLRAGFQRTGLNRDVYVPYGGIDQAHPGMAQLTFELLADDDREAARRRVWKPATLEGTRIRLRAFRHTDVGALVDIGREAGRDDVTELTERAWLVRHDRLPVGSFLSWCIVDRTTDQVLGTVSAFDIGHPYYADSCEIGYWLRPSARGRGVMVEAVEVLLDHLFAPREGGGLGLRRVTATTEEGNTASLRVMHRAGMTEVARLPEAVPSADGPAMTAVVCAVTRDADRAVVAAGALEPVALVGDRFHLRAFTEADLPRVVEGSADPRTQRWLVRLPAPYTEQDARRYLAHCAAAASRGEAVHWCIADIASNECLGSVGLRKLDAGERDHGEIGYWTHPAARGRGLMSAAVRLVARHAVIPREDGGLGRRRLVLRAAAENVASRHVAEAAGFQPAGVERAAMTLRDGTVTDVVWFDLLADEVAPGRG
ncbi:MAG TPA: GNAT family N-acetyltransferase [Dermatophilaceae bacterium]|nr:GNAT family N-acetyltransferase [Dermatophilaceae bacterium]